MAKASKQSSARKSRRPLAPPARPQAQPCRARMQNRGSGDSRKAVQAPREQSTPEEAMTTTAVTRVTHETEVRGTETRVERVVERAPKPSLPDVDRAAPAAAATSTASSARASR